MCGVKSCPHAWREILSLRVLVNDLAGGGEIDLMWGNISPGLLLYDVCTLLSIDPVDVLGAELVGRITAMQKARLWPTLTEAEDAEMVELDNVRVPYDQAYIDEMRRLAMIGAGTV